MYEVKIERREYLGLGSVREISKIFKYIMFFSVRVGIV